MRDNHFKDDWRYPLVLLGLVLLLTLLGGKAVADTNLSWRPSSTSAQLHRELREPVKPQPRRRGHSTVTRQPALTRMETAP